MERPGAGWLRAGFNFRDHLNSHPRPDVENRSVFALAYQGLGLSFNSPTADRETSEAPENTLGMESYSRGWSGARNRQGKPWL